MRPPQRTGSIGFTLIELVVTIALLGLLVMLAAPSFVTWIRNAQVRTVAEALQTGIRTAQAEALRRNRQVVLSFTNSVPATTTNPYAAATAVAGGRRWWIQTVPQTAAGETAADAEFVGAGTLADSGSSMVITSSPSVTAVCFGSDGRLRNNSSPNTNGASCTAVATSFNVNQPNADRELNVMVQLGGQLRMCDPKRSLSASTPDGCPAP